MRLIPIYWHPHPRKCNACCNAYNEREVKLSTYHGSHVEIVSTRLLVDRYRIDSIVGWSISYRLNCWLIDIVSTRLLDDRYRIDSIVEWSISYRLDRWLIDIVSARLFVDRYRIDSIVRWSIPYRLNYSSIDIVPASIPTTTVVEEEKKTTSLAGVKNYAGQCLWSWSIDYHSGRKK